jgi:hypothetical protein
LRDNQHIAGSRLHAVGGKGLDRDRAKIIAGLDQFDPGQGL